MCTRDESDSSLSLLHHQQRVPCSGGPERLPGAARLPLHILILGMQLEDMFSRSMCFSGRSLPSRPRLLLSPERTQSLPRKKRPLR
ncbi:hypothetical protein GN956_G19907 [Arapaima gigas]